MNHGSKGACERVRVPDTFSVGGSFYGHEDFFRTFHVTGCKNQCIQFFAMERIRGRLVAASARHTTPQHSPIIAQYIVFLAEVWWCFPKPQAVARRGQQPNCPLTH
jgi:hypothetical protein